MKKITIYKISNIFLVLLYLLTIVLHYFFQFFNLNIFAFWFPAFCVFFSISMFLKTIVFKSDSSLWLAVATLLIGVTIFVFLILQVNTMDYWPMALSIISLSSLIVGLIFKEIYQVKMAIIFSLISVAPYLFVFGVIKFWLLIILLIISAWVCIYVYRILPERWYSNKNK